MKFAVAYGLFSDLIQEFEYNYLDTLHRLKIRHGHF